MGEKAILMCLIVSLASVTISGLQIRGGKGYLSIFWNSALKIKLKGINTLCSLRFQC